MLTALAGKALSITGAKPLYSEAILSSFISSRNTSLIPFGYLPSGAEIVSIVETDKIKTLFLILPVCKRDFNTSGGIATNQYSMPVIPPANNVFGTLISFRLWNKMDFSIIVTIFTQIKRTEIPFAFWC